MPSLRQIVLFLCAGFAAATATAAPVAGPVRAQHLTVELLPLESSIQPGGSTTGGLHFNAAKRRLVYWVNAGDSRAAPRIKGALADVLSTNGERLQEDFGLPLGPLMDFGYED